MSIFVKKPGLSTTVQDLGRTGHLSSGFSPNGAMDRHAASVANILVGNARNASLLEFVMTGPTLRFAKQTFIALAGADFNAELNGEPRAAEPSCAGARRLPAYVQCGNKRHVRLSCLRRRRA